MPFFRPAAQRGVVFDGRIATRCHRQSQVSSCKRRRKIKGSVDHFHEGSVVGKDQALALCHVELLTRFLTRLQTCSVMIVRGEAVERDQPPCNVVCALMREEISDEVPTASRNNAAPVLGVLFETVALEWVDLIADNAGDLHWCWLTS